jgi:hypothetical protein
MGLRTECDALEGMSPSRWAPIERMIREFQEYLAPTVSQLKIENGVDCAESYPASRAASPALKKHGVYLIFDGTESQIYIGATIDRQLIDRCLEQLKKPKRFTPRWIDVIPFDREWEFLAPSLELYLIYKVKRKEHGCTLKLVNQRGIRRAHVEILNEALLKDEEEC